MENNASSPRKYAEKEAFVTGHDGTTPLEIFLLGLALPIGLRLYSKLTSPSSSCSTNKRYNYWKDVTIEFATLIVPFLLLQTSLLPYIIGPSVFHVVMAILCCCIIHPHNNKQATTSLLQQANNYNNSVVNHNRPPFLTVHRATVYIQTAIAILAVDFPIFPRRFCKTEVSGYGWMDLGAASFIIIAGWTSSSSSSSSSSSTITTSITKAVVKCTPLFILGIIRLITIKGVEYQEHVSEYGVHWNFFFTLCCVEGTLVLWKFVKSHYCCCCLSRKILPWDCLLACVMMISYQLYLSIGGGQDFIENGPRQCSITDGFATPWSLSLCSMIAANREGILGIIGYLSLRLLSESMARYCIWPKVVEPQTVTNLRQWRLLFSSVALWAAHYFLTSSLGIPNSRRSTNVPFILWVLAQNTSELCLIHFAMTSGREPYLHVHAPRIFNAVNRFGLPVFFVSNILTGLVNLLVDTIHSSNKKAILILSIYLVAVCGLALLLDKIFENKRVIDKKAD